MKTILIKDENGDLTTGKIENAEIGNIVTVALQDENGMKINATGKVIEILEEEE